MLLSLSFTNRKRSGRTDSLDAPYLSVKWIMSSGHGYRLNIIIFFIFMLRLTSSVTVFDESIAYEFNGLKFNYFCLKLNFIEIFLDLVFYDIKIKKSFRKSLNFLQG